MDDKSPETVFGKSVSRSPTPQKSHAMVNEKVSGIIAFDGKGH